ncbi:12200_t:CDS:10 [Entrophospora sp. SA101]|nr:7497_t:CDS:10 [Entrophospora sp. SA101]CAJ0835684.1 12200_t:CDS:10 [Entrophospora sp. SA101]
MNNSITKTWTQHLSSSSSIVESNSRQDASVETATTSPVSLQSNALNSQNKQGEHADENGIKRKKSKYTKESKKKVKLVTEFKTSLPNARLSDLGGIDSCIEEVLELIAMPLAHPEIYLHTGVQPPRGILLHGPPGCGKTLLANAIAGELGVSFISISAPSIVSGMSGESEKKIRDVFEEAKDQAPCLIFVDEIDAITPKRETAQREMERRIVAQLLTCMDDSLDPALRRAGRFDREISMGVPDEQAREKILKVIASKLKLSGDFDFKALAKMTPGYVGADLNALTSAAGVIAVKRIFTQLSKSDSLSSSTVIEDDHKKLKDINDPNIGLIPNSSDTATFENQTSAEQFRSISNFLRNHPDPLNEEELKPLSITNEDFIQALSKVQPSSKREGFATVPDVTWADIGALKFVRDELRMAIVEPIKHPEYFQQVGIMVPTGVLLWGPPGCGKTLLAKAVANESHINFISVKGPELLNKYVGESERGVRQVFARARASSPCVIFFDELDALCARRDDSKSEASARVVNTLLTELDGLENRKQVYVIAATNRPDIIDPAMIRPGRLDKLLYVELPTYSERYEILKTLTKKTPLDDDVSLLEIANDARSAVSALRTNLYNNSENLSKVSSQANLEIYVKNQHFEIAYNKVVPSVSKTDKKKYDSLRIKFGCVAATTITTICDAI